LLEELEEGSLDTVPENADRVFETVNFLREQRMAMVQAEMQFNFIYSVLKEMWLHRHQNISQTEHASPAAATSPDASERTVKVPKLQG